MRLSDLGKGPMMDYQAEAKRLLPCPMKFNSGKILCVMDDAGILHHVDRCPAKFRPAVAAALQAAAIKSHCGTCDGSGVIDSGGVTPWDAPIDMACPECKAKRNAAVVQGLEIAAKIFQYHRHRLRGVSADAFAICADMRDAIAAEIAKLKEKL